VKFAAKILQPVVLLRLTCAFTVKRNHTNVRCVGNSLHRERNSFAILVLTQVRNLMNVLCVTKGLLRWECFVIMVVSTQERNLTSVRFAITGFHSTLIS
jgi:hypothetical protein